MCLQTKIHGRNPAARMVFVQTSDVLTIGVDVKTDSCRAALDTKSIERIQNSTDQI
jgi:hypothetical protein